MARCFRESQPSDGFLPQSKHDPAIGHYLPTSVCEPKGHQAVTKPASHDTKNHSERSVGDGTKSITAAFGESCPVRD